MRPIKSSHSPPQSHDKQIEPKIYFLSSMEGCDVYALKFQNFNPRKTQGNTTRAVLQLQILNFWP